MLLTLVSRAVSAVLFGLPLLVAPAAAAEWTPIGPHLATVTDIEAAPSDPRVVYAATRGGGLYRSLDGGRSWARRNGSGATAQPDLNVLHVAVDPRHAATVYIGTYQSGLFKSVDGGGTWAPTARGLLPYVPANAWVAVDPVRPRTLYAWYSYYFLRSVDGGASWRRLNVEYEVRAVAGSARAPQVRYAASTNGVYKSTDGGVNWVRSSRGLEEASVYQIAVDPRRPAELYALGSRPGSLGSAVFRSSDSGRTWRASGRGLPAQSFHSAVVIDAQGTAYVSTRLGVFKSLDGGARWQPARVGLPGGSISALAAHPKTPSVLWAGTGLGFSSGGLGVYRTTNGGTSWAASRRGMTGGDVNVLALGTGAVPAIYAGTVAQGVFVRPQGSPGAGWSSRSEGLGSGNIEALLRHPEDPDVLYAAGAVGIYRSEDGGATWSPRNEGLADHAWAIPAIYSLAFNAADPNVLYAGADQMIFKSVDGGATWRRTVNQAEGFYNTRVRSLATSADDPAVLYAAGDYVEVVVQFALSFKSTDGGETWIPISAPSPTLVTVDPGDAQTVLAYRGAILRSTDGGATFTPADIELPVGGGVTTVAFDPTSPGVVYAAANGGGADPVTLTFRSVDGGATWNPLNAGGIGNSYVLSLAVDEAGALYAATRGGGVYRLEP